MTSSPFEAGIFIVATLVFLIVVCMILTSVRKLRIVMYVLSLIALTAIVFTVKSLIAMNGCVENVRNLNSALAKYRDGRGEYPASMAGLTPDYIRKIPVCPAAGADTYSQGYKRTDEGRECSFCCKGCNHSYRIFSIRIFAREDYPDFNSARDLKKRVDVRN